MIGYETRIGDRATVGRDCEIHTASIGADAEIGDGSHLKYGSSIDHHAKLGANCEVAHEAQVPSAAEIPAGTKVIRPDDMPRPQGQLNANEPPQHAVPAAAENAQPSRTVAASMTQERRVATRSAGRPVGGGAPPRTHASRSLAR